MSRSASRAMNAEEDGTVIGYMDRVEWECELGSASDGNRVYPSVEDLKEHSKCYKECGIVRVRVAFEEIIEPGTILLTRSRGETKKSPTPHKAKPGLGTGQMSDFRSIQGKE